MTTSIPSLNPTRRNFLKATAMGSGGLIISIALPSCASLKNDGMSQAGNIEQWNSNAWLRIDSDNSIHFVLDRVEMGQGTYTGMTSLLCEELEVDPEKINVSFAGVDSVYRNTIYGIQITGGSTSIASSWQIVREAGAATRMMLIKAAANTWGIGEQDCIAENGVVINKATGNKNNGHQIAFGQLAAIAATYSVPSDIPLKDKADFKIIGKYNKRLDAIKKATGTADYGIDTDLPGMKYAVFTRAPRWDSQIKHFDASKIENMPGIEQVFAVHKPSAIGVAIVAKSYWQARKAQQVLHVEWHESELTQVDDASIFAQYKKDLANDSGKNVRSEGDINDALENAEQTISAEYEMPFLAHSTLEPQNCVAWAKKDSLEIWAPTQSPDMAQVAAAKATDYSLSDIKVNTTFLGGGFGRRINQDFVAEAAAISEISKQPIKLIWSREEDTQRDWYRPSSYHKLSASINKAGEISGWNHQMAGSGVFDYFVGDAAPAQYPFLPKFMFGMLESAGKMGEGIIAPADGSIFEGADAIPYDFANINVDYKKSDSGILVGNWRSVGYSHNGFIVETFIEKLAQLPLMKAQKDSYQFRYDLLNKHPRAQAVLKLAADKANWGSPLPGCTQGISIHKSFGTWVAEVADVIVENNQIKVKRVVCAVDCGQVVNPDTVVAQMEGGIIFALTAALYGEINIKEGIPQQSNFHDYQLLRMNEAPIINVHIVDSDENPTGVGEPGVPPLASAVANAITAKTGQYFNKLPLKLDA
ncbi:MAG: xanthine dehydrogenase family protein molybdopterin-binding subunit [Oleispira sp.]|nr:xanthine dehydrogenase family protein molybdopterin-binding subunit [Oleispira sp.]MBL4880330.1 xanthine dehydrogenase family protein molybdopterin-binding subunit [Oleispira sp.]